MPLLSDASLNTVHRLALWLTQAEPSEVNYKLDRILMVYVLAGTATMRFLIFALDALIRLKSPKRLGLPSGNVTTGQLVMGLGGAWDSCRACSSPLH
jgi:hypothetical protein